MNDADTLNELVTAAKTSFAQATTPADLENAKAQFLGKSGRITELMKGLGHLSVEEKKSRGAAINLAKQAIEAALTGHRQALAQAELDTQRKAEAPAASHPGRQPSTGGPQPAPRTVERVERMSCPRPIAGAAGPQPVPSAPE